MTCVERTRLLSLGLALVCACCATPEGCVGLGLASTSSSSRTGDPGLCAQGSFCNYDDLPECESCPTSHCFQAGLSAAGEQECLLACPHWKSAVTRRLDGMNDGSSNGSSGGSSDGSSDGSS